ncbi:MAG: TRCF domain-containing protein, partial [Marinirhabdus sp.]
TIDTDFELLFPDAYVNNITERLNLYTKLNALKDETAPQNFEKELKDRFGKPPGQVLDLLDSVRVKWKAIQLGLERVVMKNGKFTGFFVSGQQSGFYQSETFGRVLQFVQAHGQTVQIKEKQTRNGLRLLLLIGGAPSVKRVLEVLRAF